MGEICKPVYVEEVQCEEGLTIKWGLNDLCAQTCVFEKMKGEDIQSVSLEWTLASLGLPRWDSVLGYGTDNLKLVF